MRFFILLALFSFFAGIKAQNMTISSRLNSEEVLREAKTGHFQWVFPENTTAENLEKLAKYYKTNFTYTFNDASKLVDVYPVIDSEDTRRVMLRFLGANQVSGIKVGNETFELWVFYEKFMKIKG